MYLVRTFARKCCTQQIFYKLLLQAENELLVSKISKKNVGHGPCVEDKACGKLVSFRKIVAHQSTWSPDFLA